jgi:hypothetical protein
MRTVETSDVVKVNDACVQTCALRHEVDRLQLCVHFT